MNLNMIIKQIAQNTCCLPFPTHIKVSPLTNINITVLVVEGKIETVSCLKLTNMSPITNLLLKTKITGVLCSIPYSISPRSLLNMLIDLYTVSYLLYQLLMQV